jgi:rSAM/selenodomain-associated transferase 1
MSSEPPPIPFCGIAVMAKASAPGRTKTRLIPLLSAEEAADLNTAFLRDVCANILRARRGASIAGYAAYGPSGSDAFFRETLPGEIGLVESWFGNFGDCLWHAAAELLRRGHGGAVVLNSDSPTLPPELLMETAAVLERPGDRAVLGPSIDGGYYLLGIKAPHRHLFDDIEWSTDRVAGQTLERAREIGLPVHVLPAWYDVDDAETLTLLSGELFDGTPFGPARFQAGEAAHTTTLLRTLLAKASLDHRRRHRGMALGAAPAVERLHARRGDLDPHP